MKTQARPGTRNQPNHKTQGNSPVQDRGGTAHPGKRTRRARNTGELYQYALKPLVTVFGSRLVCDISPDDIRDYQTRRLAAGVSARTVNIEVGALRAALKAHRLWGPISDAVEMLRERKDVGRALGYEDERKLIAVAGRSRSPVLLPLLTITLDTGLRTAQIRSLCRKDLSLVWSNGVVKSGFVTVPKSKTEAGTGRTIPLSRRACVPPRADELGDRSMR